METLMKKIVKYMVSEKMIQTEDEEVYVYALQSVVEKLLGTAVILVISLIFDLFLQTVFFLVCFSQLRKNTGGFHMKHFYSCFLVSTLIYFVWVWGIYPYLGSYRIWNLIVVLLACVAIFIIGAVNNPEIAWNRQEYRDHCRLARYVAAVEALVITGVYCLRMDDSYLWFMSFGVVLSALLVCIEKIRRRDENDEQVA